MGTFGGSYCEVLSKLILNSMITGTKKKRKKNKEKKEKEQKKKKKAYPPTENYFSTAIFA